TSATRPTASSSIGTSRFRRRSSRRLRCLSRRLWRKWLEEHHDTEVEIWLVFHKRHTAEKCISYADALDEALCFEWIDSLIKRLDDDRYARKFTPRKARSKWSDINRRRWLELRAAGLLAAPGLAAAPTDNTYAQKPAI